MLTIDALQDVLQFVKRQFVGKDAIVDLLGIALVARENAFLLGSWYCQKCLGARTVQLHKRRQQL